MSVESRPSWNLDAGKSYSYYNKREDLSQHAQRSITTPLNASVQSSTCYTGAAKVSKGVALEQR
jgi:hypothetical protein